MQPREIEEFDFVIVQIDDRSQTEVGSISMQPASPTGPLRKSRLLPSAYRGLDEVQKKMYDRANAGVHGDAESQASAQSGPRNQFCDLYFDPLLPFPLEFLVERLDQVMRSSPLRNVPSARLRLYTSLPSCFRRFFSAAHASNAARIEASRP